MKTEKLKDIILLASVFLTGAAVLIIEVIAMRILSPYFGNTIYTTSSVIGIVLAALSIGYYSGGILSDKYPHQRVFYGIIFVSGFSILCIQVFTVFFLPFFGLLLPLKMGPLISSLFLFFIPALFLGMLSPFAVKLHQKENGKVGSQSGEVFFWSTLGSIAGSFLSGFILIPHFGISMIVIFVGFLLIFWALGNMFFIKPLNKKIFLSMVIILLFSMGLLWFYNISKKSNAVYEKDGTYEKIKIVDGQWNGQAVRFLFSDRSFSSAMYLHSDELVFDYTKYYKLYTLFKPDISKALVIGGGAYSIPKAFLKDSPTVTVDVAEIEPELFTLAKKYFNLQETDRLINHTEDGRRFLNKTENTYDAIVSDVYYSYFSIPINFTTKEFFTLAKEKLSDNGVFIGNFAGDLLNEDSSFILSEAKTFKGVFPNSYFFAINSPDSSKPQNIIFLGIKGEKRIDFNSPQITQSNNPLLRGLKQKNITIDKFNLLSQREITDNFSPVEYLVGKIINRY